MDRPQALPGSRPSDGRSWPVARIQRLHPLAVTGIKVADQRQLRGQLPNRQDPARSSRGKFRSNADTGAPKLMQSVTLAFGAELTRPPPSHRRTPHRIDREPVQCLSNSAFRLHAFVDPRWPAILECHVKSMYPSSDCARGALVSSDNFRIPRSVRRAQPITCNRALSDGLMRGR